eukprot:Lankesteria_metandrocarpae@DN10614_c0_g1_i1.p1
MHHGIGQIASPPLTVLRTPCGDNNNSTTSDVSKAPQQYPAFSTAFETSTSPTASERGNIARPFTGINRTPMFSYAERSSSIASSVRDAAGQVSDLGGAVNDNTAAAAAAVRKRLRRPPASRTCQLRVNLESSDFYFFDHVMSESHPSVLYDTITRHRANIATQLGHQDAVVDSKTKGVRSEHVDFQRGKNSRNGNARWDKNMLRRYAYPHACLLRGGDQPVVVRLLVCSATNASNISTDSAAAVINNASTSLLYQTKFVLKTENAHFQNATIIRNNSKIPLRIKQGSPEFFKKNTKSPYPRGSSKAHGHTGDSAFPVSSHNPRAAHEAYVKNLHTLRRQSSSSSCRGSTTSTTDYQNGAEPYIRILPNTASLMGWSHFSIDVPRVLNVTAIGQSSGRYGTMTQASSTGVNVTLSPHSVSGGGDAVLFHSPVVGAESGFSIVVKREGPARVICVDQIRAPTRTTALRNKLSRTIGAHVSDGAVSIGDHKMGDVVKNYSPTEPVAAPLQWSMRLKLAEVGISVFSEATPNGVELKKYRNR